MSPRAAVQLVARACIAVTLAMAGAGAAITLFYAAAGANAQPRLELLAGQCRQDAVGEGVWFQSEYPYSLDVASTCASVGFSGITHRSGPWAFGLRLHYSNLGKIHAQGVYTVLDHEHADSHDGRRCNPSTMSGCVAKGRGTQRAEGATIGALAERRFGEVTVGAELGAYLYRSSWQIDIYPVNGGKFGPYHVAWGGSHVVPYGGLSLQYGYFIAMLRAYAGIRAAQDDCGHCTGFAQGTALQAAVGFSIPLGDK